MAKRAFDGDGGWFPRYDKGFGEVSEFRCAAKKSTAPASAADLKKVRKACRDVYDDMRGGPWASYRWAS